MGNRVGWIWPFLFWFFPMKLTSSCFRILSNLSSKLHGLYNLENYSNLLISTHFFPFAPIKWHINKLNWFWIDALPKLNFNNNWIACVSKSVEFIELLTNSSLTSIYSIITEIQFNLWLSSIKLNLGLIKLKKYKIMILRFFFL